MKNIHEVLWFSYNCSGFVLPRGSDQNRQILSENANVTISGHPVNAGQLARTKRSCSNMTFWGIHMPRTASFTLEKWAIWADCIFEIYRFRWRFWRKDRNRIYCRFWFTVFGIKGTAPSSENSKSFINQNVLVRPGLRKKMLKKLSFSQNWEILIY